VGDAGILVRVAEWGEASSLTPTFDLDTGSPFWLWPLRGAELYFVCVFRTSVQVASLPRQAYRPPLQGGNLWFSGTARSTPQQSER